MSALEEQFARQVELSGLPPPVREHAFAPPRRWRFDFAFLPQRIAVEINGGTWINGRHNHGSSIEREYEKLNAAALAGWTVLQFSARAVRSGEALRLVEVAHRLAIE